ncbi:MAG: prephenate dehydrogenase/arogenate dehydrogenase family protein [Candidatus Rokubacteria bacterium]|nr:prephenate dehydrogenase/arogenate dehydrogenase family protein [Candidatus Rokubacteria bacterium]
MLQRLTVVGVGLLGGSVAKAARAEGLAREVIGVGRDLARLDGARQDGTLDRITTDLADGVRGADLVVLAGPVATIERQLDAVAAAAGGETVVTDVGSTKAGIVAAAARVAPTRPFAFVGSHPMAGSEKSGYADARADLFRGATVVVTPAETTEVRVVKSVSAFWESLGARLVTMDAAAHDRAVAAISHLPHLVACALVDAVLRFEPAALGLAARGFRDTTRIAAGDPVMWRDVFLANRDAILGALDALDAAVAELRGEIEGRDGAALESALARIAVARRSVS